MATVLKSVVLELVDAAFSSDLPTPKQRVHGSAMLCINAIRSVRMASLEKYTNRTIMYELRHNTRETQKPSSNKDIDLDRTASNFSLAPADRGGAQPMDGSAAAAARQYHKKRLSEVYTYGRDDLVTACQWVITAPSDLHSDQETIFWQETYNFLNSLYGEKNCIQAIVHKDEGLKVNGEIVAGRSHLHYLFVPVVPNPKYQQPNRYGNITGSALFEEKVCADKLITPRHLQKFHPLYQKWLDEHGVNATVHSGVTGGNNRTVSQLKQETLRQELKRTRELLATIQEEYFVAQETILERSQELSNTLTELSSLKDENKALQARISELEHSLRQEQKTISTDWGSSSSWGKGTEKEWTKTF